MPTSKTWPSGSTNVTPKAYSIPGGGEFNWTTLNQLLTDLCDGAQATTFQKFAVRKALVSPDTLSPTSDCIVVSDLTTPGPVTITLPLGANKQVFLIGDGKGDAGTNNITVTPTGADTIAGASSATLITDREIIWLCYNASDSDWKVVGRFSGLPPLSNPLTTAGDLIVADVGGGPTRLAAGAAGTFLKGGLTPSYAAITLAELPTGAAGTVLHGGATPSYAQVGTADIADNAVTTVKIPDGAVTTAKIPDSAITTAKLADASITGAKLTEDARDAVLSQMGGAVNYNAAGNFVGINAGAVVGGSGGHIASGTITDYNIGGGAAIAGTKILAAFGTQTVTAQGIQAHINSGTGSTSDYLATQTGSVPASYFHTNAGGWALMAEDTLASPGSNGIWAYSADTSNGSSPLLVSSAFATVADYRADCTRTYDGGGLRHTVVTGAHKTTVNPSALNSTHTYLIEGSWAGGGGITSRILLDSAGTKITQPYLLGTAALAGSNYNIQIDQTTGQVKFTTSALKFKRNITDLPEDDSEKLYEFRSVLYKNRGEEKEEPAPEDDKEPWHYGFIADWVAEQLPHLVIFSPDGEPMSLAYERINVLIVDLLKKHKNRIESLESQVADLAKRLAALE